MNTPRPLSLRTRLTAAFVLLAVVPLLVLSALVGGHTYLNLRDEGREALRNIAVQTAHEAGHRMEMLEQRLGELDRFGGFVPLDPAAKRGVLDQLAADRRLFREVSLIDRRGKERYCVSNLRAVSLPELRDQADDPLFRHILDGGGNQFGPIHFAADNGEPLITLAVPFIDLRSGELAEVVSAELRIKLVLDDIIDVAVAAGTSVFIVDGGGRVVAHRNPSVVLREARYAIDPSRGVREGIEGGEVIAATAPFVAGERTFHVVVEREMERLFERLWRLLTTTAGVVLLALAVAAALVMLSERTIIRPILAVSNAARAVRGGDLGRRADVRGGDELGELAETFNAMTAQLHRTLGDLREQIDRRDHSERALRKANRALRTLSRCDEALVHSSSEQQLLDAVCRVIVEEGEYPLAWVGYAEHDPRRSITPTARHGRHQDYVESLAFTWSDDGELGQGPPGRAIRSGEPALCVDIASDRRFAPWRAAARERGFGAALALPLGSRDGVFGCINIYAADPNTFDEEEVRLLQEMADDTAYGITAQRERAERHDAEEQLRHSQSVLGYENHLHGVLAELLAIRLQGRTLEECLGDALDTVLRAPFAALLPKGGVFVAGEQMRRLRLTVQRGLSPKLLTLCAEVPFGHCLCGRAAESGELLFADHVDERHDTRFEGITEHGHYNVPLLSEGETVGVMVLYLPLDHPRNEQETRFLRSAALVMAGIIVGKRDERALIESKELAEAANRSKSEFLANMSHELRTPMHAILSFAGLGVEKAADAHPDKLEGYFAKIAQSGGRLLGLLNDLLDLSKLDAGRTEYSFAHHDLRRLAHTVAQEMAALVTDRRLTLEVEEGEVETTVLCDGDRLIQVLRNLVGNAVKFTPEGGAITIAFADTTLEPPDDEGPARPALAFQVSDQGVGIPEEELESVFDEFVQSSKTKTGAGGTGLGLAICRRIVSDHGGRIHGENDPAGGARFTVVLPRSGPEAERALN